MDFLSCARISKYGHALARFMSLQSLNVERRGSKFSALLPSRDVNGECLPPEEQIFLVTEIDFLRLILGVGIPLAFEDSQMTRPVIAVVTPAQVLKTERLGVLVDFLLRAGT